MTQLEQIRVHHIRTRIRRDLKQYASGPTSRADSRIINHLAEQDFRLGQHLIEQS